MRSHLLYIIFCISVPGNFYAQQSEKTSAGYISQIKNSSPDTARINLLYQLGLFYLSKSRSYGPEDSYTDSAEQAFTMGIRLADSLHSTTRLLQMKRMLGAVFFTRRNIGAGEKVFMELIDSCRKKGNLQKELDIWELMVQRRERIIPNFDDIAYYQARRVEIYNLMGRKEEVARIQLDIADLSLSKGKYEKAEYEALKALDTYQEGNFNSVFNCYYMLSVINRYKGDLDEALNYATRCVQNVDSLGDSGINPSIFYGELALVNDALGFAEESAKWYRLTLEERIKRKENILYIVRTAGFLIHQLVKINKAQEALEVTLSIQNKYHPHDIQGQAAINQYLGHCYQALGEYSKAEFYFLKMLNKTETMAGPDEFNSMAYHDIGNYYLATKKYDKAAKYLTKAIDPPGSYLISRRRDIFLSLYMADSALGNYLGAINDFRSYKRLTDSIFSERKSHQIAELQIRYQTEKKEKDIILLHIQNKAQENKMQRSALVRNFIIAAVVLLAGFLYYRYRLKSISNKKMEEQQRLIHQKNLSLTQLVSEKEWLVKEIHHRVKNNFHIVMGLLATQSRFLTNPEAIEAMRESRHRIQAMSLIHQRLYQSDNLSTISMPAYIHELVSYLRESFVISGTVQFNIEIDPLELDLSHAIPLGLILNEAITNSIKYAFPAGRSGFISISLKNEGENHCIVTIRDNGIGMNNTAINNEHSMGMKLMKGLSEDMEATISIFKEHGTSITISFYYGPEKNENL